MSSAILTSTGQWFDVLNPDPAQIDIRDIAHALSQLCRFGGHSKQFYSVATHSQMVSRLLAHRGCGRTTVLWGLLHDASEAYAADLPRPLKKQIPQYTEIEDRIQKAVAQRFDLPWPMPDEVHQADNDVLALELRGLMPTQADGVFPSVADDSWEIWGCRHGLTPDNIKADFLDHAAALGIARPDGNAQGTSSAVVRDGWAPPPAGWLESHTEYVVTTSPKRAAIIMAKSRWEEVRAKLEDAMTNDRMAGALYRLLIGNGRPLCLDVGGQMRIDADIAEHAGITDQVFFRLMPDGIRFSGNMPAQ